VLEMDFRPNPIQRQIYEDEDEAAIDDLLEE
jgi:hypothetical protein